MFEDSLVERRIAGGQRRGWATIVAFLLEAALVGTLVLIPLVFTDALPVREAVTYLVAPPPPPPPPAVTSEPVRTITRKVISEISDTGQLRMPTRIPRRIQMIKEEVPPAIAGGGVVGGVPGGIPGGQLGGVIGGIIGSTPAPNLPKPPITRPPKRVRVSQGVTQGMLVRKVVPKYPAIARMARVEGAVVLRAVIGLDGSIEKLHLISGSPLLAQAALDAVSEWRYKPYRLNGQAVEVETMITVNFALGG